METTQLIRKTLEANDVLHLLSKVRWEWNSRLTSTAGRYWPKWKNGRLTTSPKNIRNAGLVEFSIQLFARATPEMQAEIVVHEFCHMVVDNLYPSASPHGWEWKRAMARAGYPNPSRTHNIDRTGLRRRNNVVRIKIYCGCPDGFNATKNLMTRMRKNMEWNADGENTRRYCKRCRQNLRLKP